MNDHKKNICKNLDLLVLKRKSKNILNNFIFEILVKIVQGP